VKWFPLGFHSMIVQSNGQAEKQAMTQRGGREVWSFFSGAMGLDLGLEAAGVAPTLAVELDPVCCSTIRLNRPGLTLLEADVRQLHEADLKRARRSAGDVFLMVGGPPCQSFSSGGKRAALSDPRGNLIYEYLRLVTEVRPRYFVLENVANLVTAAVRHRAIADRPGQQWSLKRYSAEGDPRATLTLDPDELSGTALRQLLGDVDHQLRYRVRFGVLDAAECGAPQHRLRFVLYGSRDGVPPALPLPTHGPGSKQPFRTVRDAIAKLEDCPGFHSEYTPAMRRFFELVPPGGNWRSLPEKVQREALGGAWKAGGGKTGFFRRLDWDAPSPTITGRANRKASGMCHPEAIRPLSVRECAALQGFPASWTFVGAMNRQYMQVGNAVPLALGKAIGDSFLQPEEVRPESLPARELMIEAAVKKLRSAARNKRSRRSGSPELEAAAG
jgi:DNA (cytosine-5)-methyltransferase 1